VIEKSTILTWLILLPIAGALTLLLVPGSRVKLIRNLALAFTLTTMGLSFMIAQLFDWSASGAYGSTIQLAQNVSWIDSLNIHYYVGVDGISMPMVLLTTIVSTLACIASFSMEKNVKGYFILFLILVSAMLGVFVSLDLMLFYVFFEVSLFPMYFLIGLWGGPRREYAAIKFFLYTLLGSVGLLVVILGVYIYTKTLPQYPNGCFDMIKLATDPTIGAMFKVGGAAAGFAGVAFWLLFVGFAVKVPAVPFHTWLPDAHVEAPTPISMILAAVLLKMGGYGFMRVSYPIFPQQALDGWFWVALVGIVSILYGAFCALAQKDFKKLVAYSSVSHMGYVLLGLAVMTPSGMNGAMFQMIAHGISSAMMFFIVGVVYERAHHRDLDRLGGLGLQMPTYTGFSMLGFFASMGLPGLCGFVGEVLVLFGVFTAASSGSAIMVASSGHAYVSLIVLGVLAALTVVITAAYLLWTFQRVFMGQPRPEAHHFAPLVGREVLVLAVLGLAAIGFGVLPGMLLLQPIKPAIDGLLKTLGV